MRGTTEIDLKVDTNLVNVCTKSCAACLFAFVCVVLTPDVVSDERGVEEEWLGG